MLPAGPQQLPLSAAVRLGKEVLKTTFSYFITSFFDQGAAVSLLTLH